MTIKANSKNNIINQHYEENTSPLDYTVSTQGETFRLDVDDIKNFFMERHVGQFAIIR